MRGLASRGCPAHRMKSSPRATASLLGPSHSKLRTVAIASSERGMGPPAEHDSWLKMGLRRAASSCVELRRQLGQAGTGHRARLGPARVFPS